MKKLLLTVAAFGLAITTTNAQIFSAQDSAAFAGFTYVDADGDGAEWQTVDLSGLTGAHFSDRGEVLLSESWNSGAGALTPDNFLISPAVDLTGLTAVALDFRAGVLDPDWAAEKYSVYVVTDTSAAGIAAATAVHSETLGSADTLAEVRTVDISAHAGQVVYLVFRHHDVTDQYVMFIDDIEVKSTASIADITVEAFVSPNPTQDFLNFSMNAELLGVEIYSLDGRKLMKSNSNKVDVQFLATGMYRYVVSTTDGRLSTGSFVKK